MPMSKYNKFFGGKKGAASKAMAAMKSQYGDKKGEQVFYATKNKRKSGKMSSSDAADSLERRAKRKKR